MGVLNEDDLRKAPQKRWQTNGALQDTQDVDRQDQGGKRMDSRAIRIEELEQ